MIRKNSNTSEYLPFECISPILLKNPDYPDYPPFLSGTGFFCFFAPYEFIFFVTARHCLLKEGETEIYEYIKIPYLNTTSEKPSLAVVFSECLCTEDEDILVLVVDHNKNKEELKILKERAINLSHQDDVDNVINILCNTKGNVRTLGFSQPFNPKKEDEHTSIRYDDDDNPKLIMRPRGFYGKIKNNSNFHHRYGFEESNWDEEEYRGFSGSPVISLIKDPILNLLDRRVIGVMLTATKSRGEFISINIATNLIASFINKVNA